MGCTFLRVLVMCDCGICAILRPQLAKGLMQLYSFEQAKSQPLEAHAAAFANVKVRGPGIPRS